MSLKLPRPRTCAGALLGVALVLGLVQTSAAVFVIRKDASEPILGHLVSENDLQLVVRVEKGGAAKNIVIPQGEVIQIIHTVDKARLAALSPERPREYREYAEELSEKRSDPEARDTARRLFAIAATLDRAGEGRSAFLGLAALASTPQEGAAYRGLAYLTSADHDPALLKPWRTVTVAPTATVAGTEEAIRALAAVRHADFSTARRILESPKGKAQYEAVESIFPRKEFLNACGTGKLTDEELRKLLSAELALLRQEREGAAQAQAASAGWARTLRTPQGLAPVSDLHLEGLTGFDPQASLFRDGKWQRP